MVDIFSRDDLYIFLRQYFFDVKTTIFLNPKKRHDSTSSSHIISAFRDVDGLLEYFRGLLKPFGWDNLTHILVHTVTNIKREGDDILELALDIFNFIDVRWNISRFISALEYLGFGGLRVSFYFLKSVFRVVMAFCQFLVLSFIINF